MIDTDREWEIKDLIKNLEWWIDYFNGDGSKNNPHPDSYYGDISFSEGWVVEDLREAVSKIKGML